MPLLLLAALAHADSYTTTIGELETTGSRQNSYCTGNIFTPDIDVTLTKIEGNFRESDSGTPSVIFKVWTRSGTSTWTATTLATVSVSGSTTAWYSSGTVDVDLDAGGTYAIGWCANGEQESLYYSADCTSGPLSDPPWGTHVGGDYWSGTYVEMSDCTVYERLTVSVSDADRDGSDALEDCDDGDRAVHPGATEVWYDGTDQDCEGDDDWDRDGDGHQVDSHGSGDDCDDTDDEAYPGARDDWYDGADSDCSGGSDYDQDGDGHDVEDRGDDCDDEDPDVYGGAEDEWYDGVDSDCEGNSDYDRDGDGADAQSVGGEDCDDRDDEVIDECDEDEEEEEEEEDEEEDGDGDPPVAPGPAAEGEKKGCGCTTVSLGMTGLLAWAGAAPLLARRRRG